MKTRLTHESIIENGDYTAVSPEDVGKEIAVSLFRQMLRLRRLEEALVAEYHPADEMRCPIHFCIGQEAVPAALSLLLKPEDYLFSHHRTHGYYFAKGAPLKELFAEIYGRATGANGGLAGSQDISHTESRFFGGAILAGAVCIAAGAAFGLQHQKAKGISVAGFGEGATDEGAFWEAINHAGAKRLPILFVIENNRYATFSDQLKRQQADNIAQRVAPFGVKSQSLFGNDAPLLWKTLSEAADSVREGSGPMLVESYTYRWNSHVGPEDDGFNKYRPQREIDFWKRNCPIGLLRQKLEKLGWIDDGEVSRMESEIAAEIAECFAFAKNSPFPSEANWHSRNFSNSTPVADALLADEESADFNPSQGEAKLAPY